MARKRGGQPHNQNARKHGFYSSVLPARDRTALQTAADLQGIADEIALLRVQLRALLRDYPNRPDLYLEAASTIARLIRTQHQVSQDYRQPLRDAIEQVLEDVGMPKPAPSTETK